jgi:hypothetical protein
MIAHASAEDAAAFESQLLRTLGEVNPTAKASTNGEINQQ